MTDQIEELIDHTRRTVPYYQRLSGLSRLENFPPISKREYVSHVPELLSSEYSHFNRVADPKNAGAQSLVFEFTSGSSGYPLRTFKTTSERTRLALSLHKKRRTIFPEFTSRDLFGFIHNHEYPASSHADGLGNLADENIARVLAHLRDVARPRVLHGNTMVFVYYSSFIQRTGFDLGSWRPQYIESVSEPMTPEERSLIEQHFSTEVFDCYGCLECYNIAYECKRHKLHVNENVFLEIVDPSDAQAPCRSGEPGEILLTSLVNRAQPFIRYKTGDLGAWSDETCDCGNSRPLLRLTGKRKIDYVKLLYRGTNPSLTICGYDFFASVMYRIVSELGDVTSWFNIIQTQLHDFEVHYIPGPQISPRFEGLFHRYTEEELGTKVNLRFIEQDPREVMLINRKSRVFRSLLQSD